MYSKKQLIKAIALSCLVTFLVSVLLLSGVYTIKTNILGEDVLVRARNIITQNYVDTLSEEQITAMEDAAIGAMVASLQDPYSYYLDMKTFDRYEENLKEDYVGIGVNVMYDQEQKTLTITAPTANGPAEKAGILPLDKIVGVDDLTLESAGYDAIISHIKGGEEGSKIVIHIERGGEMLDFEVVREKLSLDTISVKMLDNKIGYIKISEFQHNSVKDFKDALDKIKEDGARGLIIDLRNNPGGYADSVIDMTDMLLPEGTIAYLEDNAGNKEYFESDKAAIDIPMAVLVNEGTASAAELMSGSLQAYDKATIVGMKTYGKAVGQSPYMLTSDTAIYLTSARYYTPKGNCIDKKGIEPDVKIDLPEELKKQLSTLGIGEDIQLQAAIEAVLTRMKK